MSYETFATNNEILSDENERNLPCQQVYPKKSYKTKILHLVAQIELV